MAQIPNRIQGLPGKRPALVGLLDVLAVGLILVDENGKVLEANRRAADLLRDDDGLGLAGAFLRASDPAATRALRYLITRAATTAGNGDRSHESGDGVLLRRPSGRRRLEALVLSIHPDAANLFAPTCPAAAVVVGDPERRPALSEEELQRCYQLTPTEARIALDLMSGETTAEIARRLGVQPNTIRWHLKQILAKTGTRRQAELVWLLLSSPLALIDKLEWPRTRCPASPS